MGTAPLQPSLNRINIRPAPKKPVPDDNKSGRDRITNYSRNFSTARSLPLI
ncbi:hypothetical protein IQ254_06190 [Nodosilinea sp. LEGE 07088]|uniref:hypothetical protein n=1 Tax=Nodosilinea sp. LEGE 07088 TaxID=2777968 RepID=UPI00187ECFDB|nr:hypothetical protein [Nodosilinea sp. LEGE 07088]MBE9136797.1 hypothetical protein [Nodosilinea sp. LEGE 07088]